LVVGAIYFGLAKIDWALGAMHPGSIPLSLAPGFGVVAVLVQGVRIWPAIFAAALTASTPSVMRDVSLADAALTLSIAAGNAIEAVVAGYLITVWSAGRRSFEIPAGIAKFVSARGLLSMGRALLRSC
jgi:hypothetical protein